MNDNSPGAKEKLLPRTRVDTTEPPMYKVLLLNDDYTTMDFVVDILIHIFKKTPMDATQIMLNVHKEGRELCGVYPYEIAETKVTTVHNLAKENGFPLKCAMEKD